MAAPAAWLTYQRRGHSRLTTTDLGVAAIARRIGYDAEEAFSRAFKHSHGSSPAPWRAQHHLRG